MHVPEPAPQIAELRNMVFNVKPDALGLSPTDELPYVWGVVMEIGYPNVLVTLVCMAEETTSLYFGHGGGIIGAGQHEIVRKASADLLHTAESCRSSFEMAKDQRLPNVGEVRFYLLTYSGTLTAGVFEVDLQSSRNALWDLYLAGQNVITQIRLIDEQQE